MAAITQTTRVARSIIHKTGRGSVIFNDRLADGKRSLKVWGWDMGEYLKAKRMLEKQGCSKHHQETDLVHMAWKARSDSPACH